ncbi:inorganic phosphate transporter [Ciceribacter ferrooxidans]|uniref:Phosphate transporter n=1 Tax=Ciceribacter ferrooxidans TaxID=2509717 RepID=A0A4Q2S555_9HYPH|nr:inorganic phosphate transporter [Ciceribacter ferrooxidans]RYB96998.1 inorganic phosphate transporter [Ciceribacter ferrooxidans]
MAGAPPKLFKPTLDKDLDKVTYVEEARHFVLRRHVPVALGMVFLVFATVFAGAYGLGQPGGALLIAAAGIGAYMAMNIGANDVTNNVGAAVGARALTIGAALVIAAVCEIAGAVIAGGDVVATIASGLLDSREATDPRIISFIMLSALLAAALWINIATWTNAPVSTTHSIVGGVMGAGIAASGFGAVDWSTMIGITMSWVVSPLLGGAIAALILWFLKTVIIYQDDKIAAARRWVPVLVGLMVGSFASYLTIRGSGQVYHMSRATATIFGATTGLVVWFASIPYVARQSIGLENRNQSLRKLFRLPLAFAAALLSFAHGANDVANAIGPVTAIVDALSAGGPLRSGEAPSWVMWIGALGISSGLLLFGPRLIRLVGSQITKLNPMRAYCVSLSSAVTVISASWLGLPVSSTHIAVGAVFGVGLFREWYTRHSRRRSAYIQKKNGNPDAEDSGEPNADEQHRRKLVRRSHMLSILAAWVITVPAAAGLAALLYWVMFLLFV